MVTDPISRNGARGLYRVAYLVKQSLKLPADGLESAAKAAKSALTEKYGEDYVLLSITPEIASGTL